MEGLRRRFVGGPVPPFRADPPSRSDGRPADIEAPPGKSREQQIQERLAAARTNLRHAMRRPDPIHDDLLSTRRELRDQGSNFRLAYRILTNEVENGTRDTVDADEIIGKWRKYFKYINKEISKLEAESPTFRAEVEMIKSEIVSLWERECNNAWPRATAAALNISRGAAGLGLAHLAWGVPYVGLDAWRSPAGVPLRPVLQVAAEGGAVVAAATTVVMGAIGAYVDRAEFTQAGRINRVSQHFSPWHNSTYRSSTLENVPIDAMIKGYIARIDNAKNGGDPELKKYEDQLNYMIDTGDPVCRHVALQTLSLIDLQGKTPHEISKNRDLIYDLIEKHGRGFDENDDKVDDNQRLRDADYISLFGMLKQICERLEQVADFPDPLDD